MNFRDRYQDITDRLTRDQILDSLGLQDKHSTGDYVLPAVGLFAAGLTVGAALGLLFAPKSGDDLRHDIRDRLDELRHHQLEASKKQQ